jgi:hypothetical protein
LPLQAQVFIACTDTQKVKIMTEPINKQYEKDLAQFAAWREEEENKAKLKQATLDKLGLTPDEVAALLS